MKLPVAKFYGIVDGTVHVNCPCCKEIVKLDSTGEDWRCPDCYNGFSYEITEEVLNNAKNEGNTVRKKLLMGTAYLLAFVAKENQAISDESKSYVSSFYKLIEIEDSEWDLIETYWENALEESYDYEVYAANLFQILGEDSDAASILVHFMFCVSGSDGEISKNQYACIKDMATRYWQMSELDFDGVYQSSIDQLLRVVAA